MLFAHAPAETSRHAPEPSPVTADDDRAPSAGPTEAPFQGEARAADRAGALFADQFDDAPSHFAGFGGGILSSLMKLLPGALPPQAAASAGGHISLAKLGVLNGLGYLEPGAQTLSLNKQQIASLGLEAGTYHYDITQARNAQRNQAGKGPLTPEKAFRGKTIGDMHMLADKPMKADKSWQGDMGAAGRYTEALGGKKEQQIDAQIDADGIEIDPSSAAYWTAHIERASGGSMQVQRKARGLQFFFLESAWEGFFPKEKQVAAGPGWKNHPASENLTHDSTRGDSVGVYNPLEKQIEQFSANHTIVVFGSKGNLVYVSPLLTRLKSRQDHDDKVGWDGKAVTSARPAGYDYFGLSVADDDGYHANVHGMLGSHGCYQIAPASVDARYQDAKGPWNRYQAWEGFQKQFLSAQASVGSGELTWDGKSETVDIPVNVSAMAFQPELELKKRP